MSADTADRSQRLGRVIAQYLEAREAGTNVNVEAFVDQYPELAASLKEFIVAHEQLQRCTERAHQQHEHMGLVLGGTGGPGSSPTSDDVTLSRAGCPSAARATFSLAPGTRFGDFELLEEIARGGMGVIFRARQLPLNRIVALKLILAGSLASDDDVARFRAEAEIAACLEHPGIVQVYEVGQVDGIYFFSMAYVTGGTLSDRVRSGPLRPREAAEYVRRIAEAIDYAHGQGVVHRDLKPSNVLLDAHGDPKVTDFGLAKRVHSALDLTTTGQVLGTPAYMPPEQAAGKHGEVSPQVDVYALGAILYYLLTGQPPFRANNPIDIMLQVLQHDPEPLSRSNRRVPWELDRICQHAMEKRPQNRYPSARRLADDLALFLRGEPIPWPQETYYSRVVRWWRHEPILLAHWAAMAATLAVAWTHFFIKHTELSYILRQTWTLLCWAALCWPLQKAMNSPRWRQFACSAWGLIDVSLFSILLYGVDPPRGPLLAGYGVLIACSGLFLKRRYVTLMTTAAMIGFSTLAAMQADELLEKPHHSAIFLVCLGVIGMIVGTLVQRIRALEEYYQG